MPTQALHFRVCLDCGQFFLNAHFLFLLSTFPPQLHTLSKFWVLVRILFKIQIVSNTSVRIEVTCLCGWFKLYSWF